MLKTAIIVDDEEAGRESIVRLLGYYDKIEIIGISGIPEEAIELIIKKEPDIVFVDVEMPVMSGFEVVDAIRQEGVNPIIIFTTGYNQYAIKAIKKQAFDYLLKPIMLDEIKDTLDRVFNIGIKKNKLKTNIIKLLSPRETEILEMLILGKTSREIGAELFISKTTVDTHRRNILEKTGAKNTTELLIRAVS